MQFLMLPAQAQNRPRTVCPNIARPANHIAMQFAQLTSKQRTIEEILKHYYISA